MGKKDAVLTAGAGCAILYGLANGLGQVIVPFTVIVGIGTGMVAFANLVGREVEEAKKRGKVIDADEIIPPSKKKRESSSNTVIDMSMEEERQIWRAEAEVAKLESKLAQKRSALKTLKRTAD